MKNKEYWEKRQERLQEKLINKGEEFYKQLAKEYDRAAANIQKEIEAFYGRFAKNNGLSYSDAKRILTTAEKKAFQMTLEEYIEKGMTLNYTDEWAKQLENASTAHRVTRLQSLQMQMRQQVETAYLKYDKGMVSLAKDIYEDGYYRQLYEIQTGTETGKSFAILDTKRIDYVVSKAWTADNETFSDRIWKDKTKLLDWLDTNLSQNLIRGDSQQKLISDMAKQFDTRKSYAQRLILTESAFFSSRATYDGYIETGVEKFAFLATLDEKTCPICGNMDGEVFDLEDYRVGVNADPLHSYCRCTTVPHFDDSDIDGEKVPGQRAARGTDGKTYYVPENMSYAEWKEQFATPAKTSDETNSPAAAVLKNTIETAEINIPGNDGKVFTIPENSGIIDKGSGKTMNIADERRKILDGTYSSRVIQGRQNKHIPGTTEFQQKREQMQKASPGSEPAILYADAQELVDKYKGTGTIKLKGSEYPRETIDTNDFVGKTWVKSLNKYVDTKRIEIFYSSAGIHVVPVNDYTRSE